MSTRLPLVRRGFRVFVPVSLVLLSGLCILLAGVGLHAHAALAVPLKVTDCHGESGPGRIGTVLASASAGARITFKCSGTIPISSTLTISTTNLTLDGSGQKVTLDGGNSTQVLSVPSGVTFTLKSLTIAHGFSGNFGGGLANSGTVTISNSTFSANTASNAGGGLVNFANGKVTISQSTFSANTARNGGGLFNGGTVTISHSTFAANSAGGGGGLVNLGKVTISQSTFSAN